jgi:heptosyltransferase-2
VSRRIVVFAPNWLGDAVLSIPAVADVSRPRPDVTVDIAARRPIAPMLPLIPGRFGEIVLGDRAESVAAVSAGRYDIAILLPNSFGSAWTAWRAGVAERWGYRREFRGPLLTRGIARPRRVHQAEYYQRLTTELGFERGPQQPRLEVPADLRTIGERRLLDSGWDGATPLVAVAPGAAYGGAKRWPAERFAATIDALARDGVRTVITGAAADRAAADAALASVRSAQRPIDLVGDTDLSTLAGVLVHCRAIVTNDSGAMHFAAALGLDVTAMFGPTNERATAPLGPGRIRVVRTDVWCRPCMLRECPLRHRCMTGISVDEVVDATRASL